MKEKKQERRDDFWNDPQRVAEELFGKHMVVGDVVATIRRAQGFARDEGMRGLYRPMLEMEPGSVYCPRLTVAILTVIVVMDHGKTGGRVLIREVEIGGRVISGPGKVSESLGITVPRLHGTVRWLDKDTFQIDWREPEKKN